MPHSSSSSSSDDEGHKKGHHGEKKHSKKHGGHSSPHGGHHSPPHGGHHDKKTFFIVSEMNRKVVDIEKGNDHEGAKVIMYDKHSKDAKNQLWYLDSQGFIRSALNDMVFSSSEKGKPLKMTHYKGESHQQWKIDGKKIVNHHSGCLDITGNNNSNSAELCGYDYHNGSNQHWIIEYSH